MGFFDDPFFDIQPNLNSLWLLILGRKFETLYNQLALEAASIIFKA